MAHCSTLAIDLASTAAECISLDQELSEVYRAHSEAMFRYAAFLSGDTGIAQDSVQEAFLKYYVQRKRGQLQEASVKAWLFQVLRNYILDYQKSHGARMSVGLDEARECCDQSQSPQDSVEYSEAVRRALTILSPRELQCVQLRAEGFSYKEIATIMSIESGTVATLLARSSEKIYKNFKLSR